MRGSRPAASLAAAWGLVATVVVYAALRIGQRVVSPGSDPAVAGWSVHAGLFWRAWTGGFGGGLAAFVVFANLTSHSPLGAERRLRAARALAPGIAIAAALVLAQAIWFP